MKVFKFEKDEKYKIKKIVNPIKLKDEQMFNNIIINNPSNSKSLCIINSFIFKISNGENRVHFLCSNREQIIKKKLELGCLNIDFIEKDNENNLLEDDEDSEMLELDTKDMKCDSHVDILGEHFLVVLPGGSICIKLDSCVSDLELAIDMGEEVI